MKLNNKGFALTSIVYMLIVLFLLLMLLILANLASRKVVLDKIKYDVKTKLNQGGINVTEQSLYDTLIAYYNSNINPGKNGSQTIPGRQIATTNEGLIMSKDDSGTTYYFRGNVDNNYVSFAGKIFRIIRINGDGTVRLILNEGIGSTTFNSTSNVQKNSGYTFDRNSTEQNSKIKQYLENWYNGTGEFVGNDDPLVLRKDRIYDVLSIERGWYRIVDETGEDYLFPPDFFIDATEMKVADSSISDCEQ